MIGGGDELSRGNSLTREDLISSLYSPFSNTEFINTVDFFLYPSDKCYNESKDCYESNRDNY